MARIVLADVDGALVGFVTVDPKTIYLDQIVVAPEHWGSGIALALLDEAKRLSPKGSICSSTRTMSAPSASTRSTASSYAGEDKNPVSGLAVNRMAWRA